MRIDGPGPLSQSVLWRWQREFYDAQGPAAFTTGVVPWRITSCLLLASTYADVAAAYQRDVPGKLHLVELGGGVGRLAFHLMRALTERGVDFHYRFTDASQANVDAASVHPQLKAWQDAGTLSLQKLDALSPAALVLPPGPVVVIANYLFDTLPHDAWRAEQGRAVGQSVVVDAAHERAALSDVSWCLCDSDARAPAEVAAYAAKVGEGRFLWPVGAIACMDAIAATLKRPHLWLVADKGPADRAQISGHDTAELARHGCVSASVNFDALRDWAGSRPFFAPSEAEVRFGAYALASGPVPAVSKAWVESGASNLPLQAEALLAQWVTDASVPQLLQALAFTLFDPDALLRIAGPLRERETPAEQIAGLVAAMDEAWRHRFELPEPHDLAFEIATVLHRAGQLSAAAAYYEHSLRLRGPHATTHFNRALCLLDLGKRAEGVAALEATLKLDPEHKRARALL